MEIGTGTKLIACSNNYVYVTNSTRTNSTGLETYFYRICSIIRKYKQSTKMEPV